MGYTIGRNADKGSCPLLVFPFSHTSNLFYRASLPGKTGLAHKWRYYLIPAAITTEMPSMIPVVTYMVFWTGALVVASGHQ